MAPELHGKENRLREASLHHMKRVDVWAYAMVVFCIVNPGLKHPYQRNVEDYSEEGTPNCLVQKFIEKNEKPLFQEKYASPRQEEWAGLKRVYENCAKISVSACPEVRDIVKMVRIEKLATTASENPMEVHLKVSQYTSVENVDQQLQHAHQMNDQQHVCDVEIPDEAINACSFLTIMIAHEMHETEEMPWNFVAETAEITLVTFPRILNKFRDIALFYDIMEAYTLLRNNNCIPECYYCWFQNIGPPHYFERVRWETNKIVIFRFYKGSHAKYVNWSTNAQCGCLSKLRYVRCAKQSF